jgi:putative transcriptional regulator
MKNNIKKLRTEKRISQQKLAENLGVSRQTINSIEKGRFDPSLKLTIKIVRFFDKDLESIFNGNNRRLKDKHL